MDAIQLNGRRRPHPYAFYGLEVSPNPPQVGKPTTLTLALNNSGSKPLTVHRINFKVSQFGMGLGWEALPAVEQVPVDPHQVKEVSVQWTPTEGGHRCVRASIYINPSPTPTINVGRNLDIIYAHEDETVWRIPFRLGNPEEKPMPIMLNVEGSDDDLDASVYIHRAPHRIEAPIWLNAHEEVDAMLLLRAQTDDAIRSIHTVEARIRGRLIDGIQVELYREASVRHHIIERVATSIFV